MECVLTLSDVYESVVEDLPLFVYRIDLAGRLTFVNKALIQHLQLEIRDILGKTAYDFYPKALADKYRQDDARVIESGKIFHEIEKNVDPNSGQENYVEIIKTPVKNAHCRIIGVQGVFWDISERLLRYQDNSKREQLLKTIAEQSPDYVMLLDEDFRIVYLNRAIEGVDKHAFEGQYLPYLTPAEGHEIESALSRTLSSGEMSVCKTSCTDPRGVKHYFETRAFKLLGGPKNVSLYLISSDITNRVRREQELQQAAAVFTFAKDAIVISNDEFVIIDVNKAFIEISGLACEEAIGSPFTDILTSESRNRKLAEINRTVVSKGDWQGELEIKGKHGAIIFSQVAISAVKDPSKNINRFVILISDITKHKHHQMQLEKIAHFDSLTGLPNRYLLDKKLKYLLETAEKNNSQIAVLYLDLDGFKEINDSFGHQLGDRVLVQIARRMREVLDQDDIVARLGGDEFVIVIPQINRCENCNDYYEKILQTIEQPIKSQEGHLKVSASLGVTYFPQSQPVDADQLIRQADVAMYEAKLRGKNRISEFNAEKDRQLRNYGQTISQLKRGLSNHELRLFFQPRVNMRSGECTGAEALLRWQHPESGLIMPNEFLPATAGDEIAVRIDQWVIENALQQVATWQEKSLNINISINLFLCCLQQIGFISYLQQVLRKYPNVRPAQVTFEILESGALQDLDQVSHVIQQAKALDVGFSLDDFGTGFSTLSSLKKLPAEELKIDRSFVRDMLIDEDDLSIIRGIMGLADAFHKCVVAEGVESEEHGTELLRIGCELAQGYAIAKPMTAMEFEKWYSRWKPFTSWQQCL